MRHLYCLLIFCGFALVGQAQRLHPGLYAGPCYSTLHNSTGFAGENQPDLAANIGWKSGFMAGVDLPFRLADKLSLLSGVQYTEKGDRIIAILPSGPEGAINFLYYLGGSALLDYRLSPAFSVQTGLEYSRLLGTSIRPASSRVTPDQFPKYEFSRNDVGLLAGIEYRLGSSLFFRARYSIGLVGLNNIPIPNQPDPGPDFVHQYNRSIQLSMGFRCHP